MSRRGQSWAASGKAIFVGGGATVNRSVAGIDLISVRLHEPDAVIEVYVAWRKGEDSPLVEAFLNCIRNVMASGLKSSLRCTT